MKWMKYGLLTLLVVLVGIQAIRPALSNPPVDPTHAIDATATVPPDVGAMLRRSCYDCHSSETRWPWYSKVAPVSWFLADHVKDGRRELSFSEFATYPKRKAARKLEEACEQIREGEMPMKVYLPLHPDAKLSASDRQVLCSWFNGERARILSSMTPAERAAKPRPNAAPEREEGREGERE